MRSSTASHRTQLVRLLAFLLFSEPAIATDKDLGPWDVVLVRDVMVPMRDGVTLATDLYFPAKDGKAVTDKLPTVLMRTPYDKEQWDPSVPRFFATHGYLSVAQDCRGRYKSGGDWFPFRNEPQDGYDTIEWLAKHPSCNGKVGMHGVSYMAWVQYHAATQNPPHLVTMIPRCGPINAYTYCVHLGGTSLVSSLQWNVYMATTSHEAQKDPAIAKKIIPMRHGEDFLRYASQLPWKRGQTPLAAVPQYEDAVFQMFFEHPNYDDFWRAPGFAMDEYLDRFPPDMPLLSIVGWYEIYPRSVVNAHEAMVTKGRPNQFLLVGPWTHANTNPSCGDANFGPAATEIPGVGSERLFQVKWFDRWLKGDPDAHIGAPVKIFVMGGGDGRKGAGGRLNHGGAWHTGDVWPPKQTRMTPFYLNSGSALGLAKPTAAESSTSYDYDPHNTLSSDGRCEIDYGPAAGTGFTGMGPRDQVQHFTLPGHGQPGKPVADRKDVLVFHTEPLARDVKIAGDIVARLQTSSDAPDTDFYLKLIDVYPPSADYPAGYAFPVTDGVLRARFRNGFEKPQMLEAGKTYELTIPLQPVANLFKAGHRIRLDISSSSFPNFDINRNRGDLNDLGWRIAHNTVHHAAGHASLIELPVWQHEGNAETNR